MHTLEAMEMYAERAKKVQARLRRLGIPIAVQIQYTEQNTIELAVQPSTAAIICLMEVLAYDLEAGLKQEEEA